MKNIYLAAAALILTLAACTKEIASTQGCDITIDASIGAMTKVSYNGASTSFTAGDQIAVYAWLGSAASVPASRVVDGVVNSFDGSAWTPATQMLWKTVADPHYFLGIYPVRAITDFAADPYTLDPSDYETSDLLVATNLSGVKSADGAVALNFDHMMAKLNVNLKFRSEFGAAAPAVSGVTVTARKTAAVNYLTKTVTATASEGPSPVDIPVASTAATGYALSFSGLQVPQSGVTTVTITIGGNEYVYTSATDIPLESGKYTTLGLVVGKDKVELGSVSVSDWTAGQDLPGGEALLADPYNGYAYMDLGLPSGLKWATMNVGASEPEEYGDYFAWGETDPMKTDYSWSTYKFELGTDWQGPFRKYVTDSNYGTVDNKAVLDPEDDAARVNWGGKWRMPTDEEWTELSAQCTWVWAIQNGINGKLVTGPNGNSIFLPAAGGWGDSHFVDGGPSAITGLRPSLRPSRAARGSSTSMRAVGSTGSTTTAATVVRSVLS